MRSEIESFTQRGMSCANPVHQIKNASNLERVCLVQAYTEGVEMSSQSPSVGSKNHASSSPLFRLAFEFRGVLTSFPFRKLVLLFAITSCLGSAVGASAQTISTIAGNGTDGYSGDGGAATSAEINYPGGVAIDSSGNVYVADTDNNRIRKISGGVITTFAGNGNFGYSGDGGAATSAELDFPEGVAVDSSGNVYIADSGNNRICKVSGGTITTVAGNGTAGYSGDSGSATSAEINYPVGVAFDSSGNFYIADSGNSRIRKVSSGIITTVAGDGSSTYSGDGGAATSAGVPDPAGVAVDGSNNIFIVDQEDNRIRKVTASSGIISTVAGTGAASSSYCGPIYNEDNIAAIDADIACPAGVAVDTSGNFYIADMSNQRIRKVTVSTGIITTVAGNGTEGFSGDGGSPTSAELNNPSGVSISSSGSIYIADTYNQRIRLATQ